MDAVSWRRCSFGVLPSGDDGAGTDGEVRSGTAEAGSDEYGRGISFFDAVYGFAITLLVANVDPPSPEEWRTLEGLAGSALGSQLLGLALSFAVIAVFWRANVLMMRTLRGMDGATVGANLVAVGFILLIPFTTQGISDPVASDLPTPVVFLASVPVALTVGAEPAKWTWAAVLVIAPAWSAALTRVLR